MAAKDSAKKETSLLLQEIMHTRKQIETPDMSSLKSHPFRITQ